MVVFVDTMVNNLLQVDRQARQILDEAKRYREKTLVELEQEKRRIGDEINERANRHIKDARSSHTADEDDEIAAVRAHYEALTAALDKQYEAGRAEWENVLFERCKRG